MFHFGLKVGEGVLGSESYMCMYTNTIRVDWGQTELTIQEEGWLLENEVLRRKIKRPNKQGDAGRSVPLEGKAAGVWMPGASSVPLTSYKQPFPSFHLSSPIFFSLCAHSNGLYVSY